MARQGKKRLKRLKARIDAWEAHRGNQHGLKHKENNSAKGHWMTKPGSLNK